LTGAQGTTAPPEQDFSTLAEAASLAFRLHAAQRRKGTDIPYIAHLMAVAALVLEHGGDEEQAIAALLHDAIEDCGVEHEAGIAARFGPRVAAIVRACTDAEVVPKPPWRARKEAYIAHLDETPPDALLVSACDKLHNARAILADLRAEGASVFARFNGGRDGTLWYYATLADRFATLLPGRLARELAAEVAALHAAASPGR
jgi:(p)ppGpp synthase/HD superfamily hydrolase